MLVEAQETPMSVVSATGSAEMPQVEPPSVLWAIPPRPTAMQREVSGHETPSSSGVPAGSDTLDQLAPPLVLSEAEPAKLLSPPTARQLDELAQSSELKPP